MARIRIDAKLEEVERALRDTGRPERITAALNALGRVLVTRIQLTFRRSTAPNGARWAPLKLRQGQPLRDTGRLLASITSKVQDREVVVGTNVQYARVHQFGAVIKPVRAKLLRFPNGAGGFAFARQVKVPARPFMPIGPSGQVDLPASWSAAAINAMARAISPTP